MARPTRLPIPLRLLAASITGDTDPRLGGSGWLAAPECVRHRAPPGVLHEHRLFLGRCWPVFGLYDFQRANGGKIGLGFLLEAALADAVSGGYAEVVGKG